MTEYECSAQPFLTLLYGYSLPAQRKSKMSACIIDHNGEETAKSFSGMFCCFCFCQKAADCNTRMKVCGIPSRFLRIVFLFKFSPDTEKTLPETGRISMF
jgi:hypothetical protein